MSGLDDTTRCPLAARCESCTGGGDLGVETAWTPVGVLCLTLRAGCADAWALPPIRSWGVVVIRVGEHCTHLGVNVDEMVELMEEERDRPT